MALNREATNLEVNEQNAQRTYGFVLGYIFFGLLPAIFLVVGGISVRIANDLGWFVFYVPAGILLVIGAIISIFSLVVTASFHSGRGSYADYK